MNRTILQQALDALRQCEFTSPPAQRPIVKDAITALREALAAPQPEPVAEIFDTFGNSQDPNKAVGHVWLKAHYFPPKGAKLYAAPPAAPAVPLTDEQKQRIHNETGAGHSLICLVESYIRGIGGGNG